MCAPAVPCGPCTVAPPDSPPWCTCHSNRHRSGLRVGNRREEQALGEVSGNMRDEQGWHVDDRVVSDLEIRGRVLRTVKGL